MATPVDDQTPGAAAARCADCAAPLARDQRYCVACGARRGALAPLAAGLITPNVPAAAPAAAAAATFFPPQFEMPNLRAVAVAVMALLGFGVIVGSAAQPLRTVTPAAVALMPGPVAAAAPLPAPTVPVVDIPATTPVADNVESPSGSDAGSDSGAGTSPKETTPAPASKFPPVKHVFLIVLSGQGFDQSFGDEAAAPYLAKTLTPRGELLADYHAVAQGQLANEVALVSGQGPTLQTTANCPTYTDIAPATTDKSGQVQGDGCVYPQKTQTIADQLTADGKSWKAYLQGFGASAAADAAAVCRHPVLGAVDGEHDPRPGDPYVTWRNPFAYFHAITDGEGCGNEADLDELATDLKQAGSTPALAYIVPDRCHDGSEGACGPDSPGGMAAADEFLRTVVPAIEASPAYKDGGLIAITFDAAPQTGQHADSSSCCDQPAYPNLPATAAPRSTPKAAPQVDIEVPPEPETQAPVEPEAEPPADPAAAAPDPAAAALDPTAAAADPAAPEATDAAPREAQDAPEVATPVSPPTPADAAPAETPAPAAAPAPALSPAADAGGGKVGLLLISAFVKAGTVNRVNAYNHFSLLRSIEDLFGLVHLGYAADPALPAFDKAVYNAPPPKAAAGG